MRVESFADASAFLARTDRFLLTEEAKNNLLLSVALALLQNPLPEPTWYAAVVDQQGDQQRVQPVEPWSARVLMAAIWARGHRIVLSDGPQEAAELLASTLLETSENKKYLPGVIGTPVPAQTFARLWTSANAQAPLMGEEQVLFRLDFPATRPTPPIAPGRLRRAWLEDLPLMQTWAADLVKETGVQESPSDTMALTRRAIESRQLFVWEDKKPVCMAGHSGHTPAGARINSVYVPPEMRRKGYARSCVHHLGEWLHQSAGKVFVCLYALRSGDASQRLYTGLGYRPIDICREYWFENAVPTK
jgi:predicted GNAT family acetyltransferase